MKTLAIIAAALICLMFLTLYAWHNWVMRPKRIVYTILRALKNGSKTPPQLAQIAELDLRSLESFLDSLLKYGFIRREANPAIDPLKNPDAPELIILTEDGATELGTEGQEPQTS